MGGWQVHQNGIEPKTISDLAKVLQSGGRLVAHHPLEHSVDDVAAETQACLDAGWTLAAAGAAPDDGFGVFTYVVPPSGYIVELVWSAVLPRFEAWWAGGTMGNERA